MAEKRSLDELKVLKGIAIIFVVLVHICIVFEYYPIRMFIHSFKSFMYLFMFVSGFLYGYSGQEVNSVTSYIAFIIKKTKRLLVPYIVISCMTLALKYCVGIFLRLQHPVDNDFWKFILLNPLNGFAPHLWFIYVLFIIFVIFPLIRFVGNPFIMVLTVVVIYFLRVPDHFYFELQLVRYYLLFFYIGYIYSQCNFDRINKYAHYLCLACLSVLSVIFLWKNPIYQVFMEFEFNYIVEYVYSLLLGILGTFSVYYMAVLITQGKGKIFNMLSYIGIYSSAIYLLHTFFMGGFCILLDQKIHMKEKSIAIALIFFAGVLPPIIIAKYFIGKNKIMSSLILGVKKFP